VFGISDPTAIRYCTETGLPGQYRDNEMARSTTGLQGTHGERRYWETILKRLASLCSSPSPSTQAGVHSRPHARS